MNLWGASALAKLKILAPRPAARAQHDPNPMEEFMAAPRPTTVTLSKLDDAAARMDKVHSASKMLQDAGFVGDHSAAADT